MRTKYLTIHTLVLLLSSMIVFAQENDLNDKLKNIDGEVNKIVITTNDGEFVFDGEDAETLFNRMKNKKQNLIKWISEDEDFSIDADGENVMVFKSDKGDKHIIKKFLGKDNMIILDHDDIDIIEGGKKIKVEVNEKVFKQLIKK